MPGKQVLTKYILSEGKRNVRWGQRRKRGWDWGGHSEGHFSRELKFTKSMKQNKEVLK